MEGLGEQIRAIRKSKNLTLVDIAKSTHIDQATLSRIENGRMTGTIDSHRRIADALGVKLTELYDRVLGKISEIQDQKAAEKLQSFSHSSGAVAELLTTAVLQKKMMPVLLRLKAKGRTEVEELPAFSERFIYLIKGHVRVTIGNESRELKPGDSLYFTASTPHHFENLLHSETKLLSVVSPVSL